MDPNCLSDVINLKLKFIYSEKATNFAKSSLYFWLALLTYDKNKVKISQNLVAFWEYMNFTDMKNNISDKK